jgi:prolyl-tRNA editing enzyme YbaK/EbsC (Cys-tRNA(Pro) deacylase)
VTDRTIDLDQHRGMAAQKATELRRLLADVETNEKALRTRRDELETQLLAAPAANWHEAAEKAGYLLHLFAATLTAEDPRKQKLVAAVLADFKRLSGEKPK